jgi:RNA polymerase sigma factor (sigma-70 family)
LMWSNDAAMASMEHVLMVSDAALLEQYASSQDAEAFAELFRRYAGLVYGTCLRVTRSRDDAEDVAQECFLELARRAGSITSSLPGWLHAVARCRSVDALRKAASRRHYEEQAATRAQEDPGPAWAEIAPHVDHALDELPERLRLPIILHYLEGHSQSDVASELSVSQPTVSRRLDKGVAELRRRLRAAGVIASVAVLARLLADNAATAAPDTLMVSLGKMAISGVGQTASGVGASVSAGGTGASPFLPAALAGTMGGKIALAVVAGAIVLAGALALRHRPTPTSRVAASHATAHEPRLADHETTGGAPARQRTDGRPRPTPVVRSAPVASPARAVGPAAPKPPAGATDKEILEALTAKAAATDEYRWKLERKPVTRDEAYTTEAWYEGPDQGRVDLRLGGGPSEWSDCVIQGEDVYSIEPSLCQARKLGRWVPEWRTVWSSLGSIGPLFLTAHELKRSGRVEVKGTETVAGVTCYVVSMWPAWAWAMGSLPFEEDDFVAFIPQTASRTHSRLWVEAETGMVRRYQVLLSGHLRSTREVTETQQVNGLAFPAAIKDTFYPTGAVATGRITGVTPTSGPARATLASRLPANWLVADETLTIAQARRQLKARPDDANVHFTLGHLYADAGRHEEAVPEFRRAAELAPQSPTPLAALGASLRQGRKRDLEGAVSAFRQALALAGDDAWQIREQLAGALSEAGKTDEAIGEYRTLAKAGPPLSGSDYWALASLLAGKGDFEGAYQVAVGTPAALLGPASLSPLWIVRWAGQSNHLDDLRVRAEKAVAQAPESALARLLLAAVLEAQGNDQEALKTLKAAALGRLMDDQVDEMATFSLAWRLGDEDLAAAAQRAAIEQAIKTGNGWHAAYAFWILDRPERVKAFVHEVGALYEKANDVQRRTDIVAMASDAAKYSDLLVVDADSMADPQDMTAGECALAGAIELAPRTPSPPIGADPLMSGRFFGSIEAAQMTQAAQKADKMRQHGARCLERAVEQVPGDAALWALLGEFRWDRKEWQGAAEAYQRAAAADANEIEYPARAAFARARLGECEQALEVGRKGIQPWADEWSAKVFMATLEMDCGQPAAAREALAAVYASPELDEFHRDSVGDLLVRCDERIGDLDQAEAVLKQLIQDNPDLSVLFGFGGRLVGMYERQGQLDQAEAMLKQFIEQSPDASKLSGWTQLIEFYGRHGRRDEGYALAKRLLAQKQDEATRNSVEQAVRTMFDKDANAVAAAAEADLAAHPDDLGTIVLAAIAFETPGRLKDAVALFRKAAEATKNPDLWVETADLAHIFGENALVAEALGRALELKPGDKDLRARYARAAAAQGDTAPAKALAAEMQATAGQSWASWRATADMFLVAQLWDDALKAAELALALAPQGDEKTRIGIELLAGRAYAGKRDDDEAMRRLIPILGRAEDSAVLRDAADALVGLYLARGERDQAIATLSDLRARAAAAALRQWVDQRLKEIAGE